MPFINGQRVTLDEWREYIESLNGPSSLDIDIPVEGEVKPKKARSSKKSDVAAQVQAALGIEADAADDEADEAGENVE